MAPAGFNPRFVTEPYIGLERPLVVKAPISCLNSGVRIVTNQSQKSIAQAMAQVYEERFWLDRYEWAMGERLGYQWMFEDYAYGEQYEVNGFNAFDPLDPVRVFHPIKQHWRVIEGEPTVVSPLKTLNGDLNQCEIARYSRVDDASLAMCLRNIALKAVVTLGITWSGWCVEIKGPPWKVIEVNGRLGYERPGDKNYYQALGSNTPWEMVTSLVEIWRRREKDLSPLARNP